LSGPVSRWTVEQVFGELYYSQETEEINKELGVDLVDNEAKELYWYSTLSMGVI